jgi:hypothetical protein
LVGLHSWSFCRQGPRESCNGEEGGISILPSLVEALEAENLAGHRLTVSCSVRHLEGQEAWTGAVVEPYTPDAAVARGDFDVSEQVACQRSDLQFRGVFGETCDSELVESLVAFRGDCADLISVMNNVAEKASATPV